MQIHNKFFNLVVGRLILVQKGPDCTVSYPRKLSYPHTTTVRT